MIPDALSPLAGYRQFILYKIVDGKIKKPINPHTLEVHDPHDSNAWVDYQTANDVVTMSGPEYGVGFVFTEQDPFFFIDIDKAYDGQQWSEVANELCNTFNGAAVEVSQSGTGLHIIGTSRETFDHSCKLASMDLEFYTEKRFVALTGTNATGNAATDCTDQLKYVAAKYFPANEAISDEAWRTTPIDEWSGPDDDQQLIQKALNSNSAGSVFGNKASFSDLWSNNIEALARAYPSMNNTDPYDRSSADMALAQHLAFWTGKNHTRVESLMWQSGLRRDKWTHHKNYLGNMTISSAVSRCKDVYNNGAKSPPEQGVIDTAPRLTVLEPEFTTGEQFMTVNQMVEYFKGCVYVRDLHRVLTPSGEFLKPEQFKASYGGYEFALKTDGSKSTRNAWEAFRENQGVHFPQSNSSCFRPELPPGTIIEEESRTLVNTYVPIKTSRKQGDSSRFLNHVNSLFPNQRDRDIVLAYMAACVQYPGVKFQWCPIIQGGEGNGKTLLSRCVAHAVGHRYTHLPNASDLGGNGTKFNSWIDRKLFVALEEIYVSDRRELTEPLKVLVTNDRIEIQGKGADQVTGDNRANLMMFTNHKDAMSINIDGRRYAIFYTAHQTKQDLIDAGMTGSYFPDLYDWLKTEGYAIVNEFLQTYSIPDELNPATNCDRAPKTSSTSEAVALSLGQVEQEILEAIDEGRPGFAKGWVSSMALDNLLADIRRSSMIPRNKRRELLQSLGYDWHPSLSNGRVNNMIPIEGGKPRLFIKNDHIHINLQTTAEVVKHYLEAQNYPGAFGVDATANKGEQ